MKMRTTLLASAVAVLALWQTSATAAEPGKFLSHAPMRPLPRASQRQLAEGPTLFVDPARGDDANAGSQEKPLRTIQEGASRLKPGDTLCLRGGTYYEHVTAKLVGTQAGPITVRSFPGELAILDGGMREFFETPAETWEECPGGVAGEFRSTKAYRNLTRGGDGPGLLGNFGDSLVPLQGYRFRGDLQSDNPFWNVGNKVGSEASVYCGPGVWYDAESGRIHARLAPTTLAGLGDDNYRGVSDPRKVPLVIAGETAGSPLVLQGCRNVRLQDLVLRGARVATLHIDDCRNVELDGLTVYGGSTAVQVNDTVGLRMQHTACRGIGAPWTFRGSLKYRSLEARIFSAGRWDASGYDQGEFEIAYCEFTDCVDGVFVGNVRGLRFHHNLLENITDDGMFLTAATGYDGYTHGGDVQIYQNRFSRILTTFAFGVGHARQRVTPEGKQTGSGAYIFRNVFDLRRPVWYQWPGGPDEPQEITSRGRFASDHGGPAWEPMWIYHNTLIAGGKPRYDYGSDGLIHGTGHGTKRRVFNNIVCLTEGMPGSTLPAADIDFQGDGNLFWSLAPDQPLSDQLFAKFRDSPVFEASKAKYPAGWTAHDLVADPKLSRLAGEWREPSDMRPKIGSPIIDAGVEVPADWPNPFRTSDRGAPDIGAIPAAFDAWRVGIFGRLNVSGQPVERVSVPSVERWTYPPSEEPASDQRPRAAVVEGYPAFDAPIIAYLLRRGGWKVDVIERAMLEPERFADYQLLVYDGSMARAKAAKTQFDSADLVALKTFLEAGGTLLLMRERQVELFAAPEGREFLKELLGTATRAAKPELGVRLPDHPWVKHLPAGERPIWLPQNASPLFTSRGTSIIGSGSGAAVLYQLPVGKGQLIYVGWTIAQSIPHGRLKTTVAEEQRFDEQVAILQNLLPSAADQPKR